MWNPLDTCNNPNLIFLQNPETHLQKYPSNPVEINSSTSSRPEPSTPPLMKKYEDSAFRQQQQPCNLVFVVIITAALRLWAASKFPENRIPVWVRNFMQSHRLTAPRSMNAKWNACAPANPPNDRLFPRSRFNPATRTVRSCRRNRQIRELNLHRNLTGGCFFMVWSGLGMRWEGERRKSTVRSWRGRDSAATLSDVVSW
jgi:hypothetical protein